jgi:isoquinoline 1-oxidoreductase
MKEDNYSTEMLELHCPKSFDEPTSGLQMTRRTFIQMLGTGLLITVAQPILFGQRGRSSSQLSIAARLHLNQDGTITVMTGKVEEGQGPRAQLTQAAAEEMRVSVERIRLIMSDTALVPDDGRTAGSRTTPSTVPAVRQGAAAARELLAKLAAKKWKVDKDSLHVRNGTIIHRTTRRTITYADLAKSEGIVESFEQTIPSDISLTPVNQWEALGTSIPRPNSRDIVTGEHRFPFDIMHPNMLYGKILRPASYGAALESIDLMENHLPAIKQ